MREPTLHSHITDSLREADPRAFTTVNCVRCGRMIHAANNECMTTWFDTGVGELCLECFLHELDDLDQDEQRLGLP